MQVPIFEHGQSCGILYAEQKGLYTIFRAEVSNTGVCKIHAVFEQGESALGVPVPEQGQMVLRISVPTSRLPKGRLLRGELVQKEPGWSRYPGGKLGNVTLPAGRRMGRRYQFHWRPGQRLPCDALMCFFSYQADGFLEIRLDEQGRPEV